ncbi:MAG: methylenetetrahydrofolate reductase [Hyphomicrobiales bacterium]
MEIQALRRPLTATIEASPKQVMTTEDLGALFPKGTWVYLTDVGIDSLDMIVAAAARLQSLGYVPVPHIPARRIESLQMLETRIARLRNEANVDNVLLIAGEAKQQMGPYSASIEILRTDVLSRFGIARVGVAGHPEGSPVISNAVASSSLLEKADFASRCDADMYIVTQFGFDAARFIAWANALPGQGVFLPVHLGMAGPAKMTTLIKYAAICGVGASMSFLKRRGSALASLAMGYDPEPIMRASEDHISTNPQTMIRSAHVFPFGGLKKSANWLDERGTWDIKKSLYLDANVV